MATEKNETDHEGHEDVTEHRHGEMDIEVQEKTFDGFVKIVTWSTIIIIALLIFVALIGA